jgi:hypothetical protein
MQDIGGTAPASGGETNDEEGARGSHLLKGRSPRWQIAKAFPGPLSPPGAVFNSEFKPRPASPQKITRL